MQSGKSTMESMKESAGNAAASAKAGMEKAKASTKEKAERMTTTDPLRKEEATREKEERKAQAQLNKEEARSQNEEARRLAEAGGPHPGYKTRGTEGEEGYYTTAGTTPTVPAGTEGYTTGTRTGAGAGATGDPLHPRVPRSY